MKEKSSKKQLEEKITELETSRLRIMADFENYKKRGEENRAAMIEFIKGELFTKITPVLDNFRRAFLQAPKDNDFVQGMKQIEKQLEEILISQGLEKIVTSGKFDPTLHEAISYENSDNIPADNIIAEFESGWKIGSHIIKPAKVRVSKGK